MVCGSNLRSTGERLILVTQRRIEQLEVLVLPALSMANLRELLKAVLPLKQLSPSEATRDRGSTSG